MCIFKIQLIIFYMNLYISYKAILHINKINVFLIQTLADPPSPPIISGYVEGSIIPAGSVQKLLCVSSGGNPLANLVFYKNDKKVMFIWYIYIYKRNMEWITHRVYTLRNVYRERKCRVHSMSIPKSVL